MNNTESIRLQLYESTEFDCSYLPNLRARSHIIAPAHAVNGENYQSLLDQGFRRSGLHVYRPACESCDACQSLRINVKTFTPTRSQKRARTKFSHLSASVKPLEYTEEHYNLYQRYQKSRHSDGEMPQDSDEQYRQFLLNSHVNSMLIEFREGNQLVMVSAIDQTTLGLSAVYTFFDTAPKHSGVGTYNVLWQIELAQQLKIPYVYLGYYIAKCNKMNYKTKFAAAEVLKDGTWQPLPPA